MKNRFIRLPEVMRTTGLSRTTIHRRVKEGTFPQPVKIGPVSIAFVEAEVDDWIERKIAESRKPLKK